MTITSNTNSREKEGKINLPRSCYLLK